MNRKYLKSRNTEKRNMEKRLSNSWRATKFLLNVAALWPISIDNSFFGKTLDLVYFLLVAFMGISQLFLMSLMCWINYTDFVSAAENIGPMMQLFISSGKICIYRYQRPRLAKLAMTIETCVENKDFEEYNHLENYMKLASVVCGSFYGIGLFLSIAYFSGPLFLSERVLPFDVYYPWDWKNSTIFYIISYCHEILVTLVLGCVSGCEFSYIWSVFHCSARLKVIRDKMLDFPLEKNEIDRSKILSSLIKLHTYVLHDIETINDAYTYIVMLLFAAVIVAICCAGLAITSADSSITYVFLFIILAMYYAQQLLFYYLPGEIVAGQAEDVAFAAYSSGWESLELKHRKTFALMIMRANASVKLLAGNLSPLRLENYMSFLATTASYFTSVRAMTEEI